MLLALLVLLGLLVLPVLAAWRQGVPPHWIAAYVLGLGLLTYGLYAHDKRKAREGEWRVAEAWLHLLELLGGWPGAFIAQRHLRNKSSKASYQFTFWLIVAGHQFAAWFDAAVAVVEGGGGAVRTGDGKCATHTLKPGYAPSTTTASLSFEPAPRILRRECGGHQAHRITAINQRIGNGGWKGAWMTSFNSAMGMSPRHQTLNLSLYCHFIFIRLKSRAGRGDRQEPLFEDDADAP